MKKRNTLRIRKLEHLSPAKAGAGIRERRDPRVTLAGLANPGLLSVVATRLVDADIRIGLMLASFPFLFGRNPTTWVATFFSYQNILSLANKNRVAGECLGGKYFVATDMILVAEVTR